MSLLSRLADRIGTLNTEVTATDALGLILADPVAAGAMTAAIQAIAPGLPTAIRYSTQEVGDEGRPDIVGTAVRREVLHIEGKFWAGLTPTQARGGYLDRMRRQHAEVAPTDSHVGVLVFVVPPRRVISLMDELTSSYQLTDRQTVGPWTSAETPDRMPVAVISWEELLSRLTAIAEPSVAEDARQLLDLVQRVDHHSYIPWTDEQRTDQDVPRRILRLAAMVETVHGRLLSSGVATSEGRRQTITSGGHYAFGKRMRLGGMQATVRVSLILWARHGRSPLWLSLPSAAAPIARRAYPGELIESNGWTVVPIPLPVDTLEEETIGRLVQWLTDADEKLRVALGGEAPPTVEGDDEEDVSEESL